MPVPTDGRLRAARRPEPVRRSLVAALVTALLMQGPGVPWIVQAQQGLAIEQDELFRFRSGLQELHGTLEAILDAYPTETFDTLALSSGLDFEPSAVIAWVQRNVAWVPYAGKLRGADGVLLDRRGNSLDQALLLATLLDYAGLDVRLANALLAEDAAEPLLDGVISAGATALQNVPAVNLSEQVAAQLARTVGVPLAELRAREAESLASSQRVMETVRGLADAQAAALVDAVPRGAGGADERRTALRALMDHWWVQYKDGTGWKNADPIFAGDDGAAPGWLPQPARIYAPDKLPEALTHRVTLQVVAEQWSRNTLTDRVALELAFSPAEFVETPLTVSFLPLSFTSGAPSNLSDSDQLRHIALEETEWLPVLGYRDQTEWASSIYTDGRTNQRPNLTPTSRKFSAAQAALGGLGSPQSSASHLSAVWLDYRFDVPGEPTRVVRRQIFDLLGEDLRGLDDVPSPTVGRRATLSRGLALIGETHVLPAGSWVHTPFVQHLWFTDLLANLEPAMNLSTLLDQELQGPGDPAVRTFQELNPLPADLYLLQLYRSQVSRHAAFLYLSRPNVLSRHMMATEREGRVVFEVSYDIVANDVSVLPVGGIDPYRSRIEQGVLDTALEVVVGSMGADSALAGFSRPDNASGLLRRSESAGLEWVALRAGEEAKVRWGAHHPDAAARIRLALERGAAVYMPAEGMEDGARVVTSWWEIDPGTGQTLGIGPKGWGQDTSGEIVVFQAGVKPLLAYASQKTIRATLFCAFAAATAIIVMAVGVTSAAIISPMLGGIFGVLVGLKAGDIMPVVFQACIEHMLFRAP